MMSDLNIKDIKIEEAKNMNFDNCEISLKLDGTLLYWIDGDLISARGINRNDRFSHIVKILKENNFPNCYGEMFIPNGNVFDVSSKENWNKAFFMPIDLFKSPLNYRARQKIIDEKIINLKLRGEGFIAEKIIFKDIKEGWDYVVKNKQEGLVIKSDYVWYKVKILYEAKVKIKEHETGKDKGTFILENGSRISGTSMDFVGIYELLRKKNEDVYAEVEYPFITDEGKLFQPRLRKVGNKEEILGK